MYSLQGQRLAASFWRCCRAKILKPETDDLVLGETRSTVFWMLRASPHTTRFSMFFYQIFHAVLPELLDQEIKTSFFWPTPIPSQLGCNTFSTEEHPATRLDWTSASKTWIVYDPWLFANWSLPSPYSEDILQLQLFGAITSFTSKVISFGTCVSLLIISRIGSQAICPWRNMEPKNE